MQDRKRILRVTQNWRHSHQRRDILTRAGEFPGEQKARRIRHAIVHTRPLRLVVPRLVKLVEPVLVRGQVLHLSEQARGDLCVVKLDGRACAALRIQPVDVHERAVGDAGRIRHREQRGDVHLAVDSPLVPVVLELGEDVVVADNHPRVAPVHGDPRLALAHEVVRDRHLARCVPVRGPPFRGRVEGLHEAVV